MRPPLIRPLVYTVIQLWMTADNWTSSYPVVLFGGWVTKRSLWLSKAIIVLENSSGSHSPTFVQQCWFSKWHCIQLQQFHWQPCQLWLKWCRADQDVARSVQSVSDTIRSSRLEQHCVPGRVPRLSQQWRCSANVIVFVCICCHNAGYAKWFVCTCGTYSCVLLVCMACPPFVVQNCVGSGSEVGDTRNFGSRQNSFSCHLMFDIWEKNNQQIKYSNLHQFNYRNLFSGQQGEKSQNSHLIRLLCQMCLIQPTDAEKKNMSMYLD